MGLLDTAAARNSPAPKADSTDNKRERRSRTHPQTNSFHQRQPPAVDIQAAITAFHRNNALFHCIVLRFETGRQRDIAGIAEMVSSHGAECFGLPGENVLVLLPSRLDMELFSHQLARSTGSTVVFQFSANTSSIAIETLNSYLF